MPDTPPDPTPAPKTAAEIRREKRALAAAALRRIKSDEAAAGEARALARQKKREENQRKHREDQALKKRALASPDNTELWHAVATRQAQGEDLLAACLSVYGDNEAEAAAERLRSDGRYSRLLARYKASQNKTDDQIRHDLESFYFAMMHDSELDPKARLTAAKQLQQLRNLERQQVEVTVDSRWQRMEEQLRLAESEPLPWQQHAIDV